MVLAGSIPEGKYRVESVAQPILHCEMAQIAPFDCDIVFKTVKLQKCSQSIMDSLGVTVSVLSVFGVWTWRRKIRYTSVELVSAGVCVQPTYAACSKALQYLEVQMVDGPIRSQ